MNTRTFARLLAKEINTAGDACRAVARKSINGGWHIVDADYVDKTILYSNIHWLRSQEEYRIGKVDVFQATTTTNHFQYFYVGPHGQILD